MIGIFFCLQVLVLPAMSFRISDVMPKLLELYDKAAPGEILPDYRCDLYNPYCDEKHLCDSVNKKYWCRKKALPQEIADPRKWKLHTECLPILAYKSDYDSDYSRYYFKGCKIERYNPGRKPWCQGKEGAAQIVFICINIEPIDGNWTLWSDWSTCSKSCGGGDQSRSRQCTNPSPQNEGKDCRGRSEDIQNCNSNLCPLDSNWILWSDWSTCTKSCGGGDQSRSRQCTNPSQQNEGKDCEGISEDIRNCNSNPCPSEMKIWLICLVVFLILAICLILIYFAYKRKLIKKIKDLYYGDKNDLLTKLENEEVFLQ